MVKTGSTEHAVTYIGFPSECPDGHRFAPGLIWDRPWGCKVDAALHSGVECGVCGIHWVDLACTVLPGWRTLAELRAETLRYGTGSAYFKVT